MTNEEIAQRNRENSMHSTGPRTEAGRQRSSLNAYRNGLNGQIVCSTPEELAVFKLFCAEIREELAPVGPIERFLAKSIAENMYRCERARSIESGIWADGYREHVEEIGAGHPEVDTALSASRTSCNMPMRYRSSPPMREDFAGRWRRIKLRSKPVRRRAKPSTNTPSSKPNYSWSTRKARERPTSRARTSRPPLTTVASFFQPPKSPADATAKSASAPPGPTISTAATAATRPPSPPNDEKPPQSTSRRHNPHCTCA